MKSFRGFAILSVLIFLQISLFPQSPLLHYPDSLFSTYYHQRVSHFRTMPYTAGDIIFLGNSITDGSEWSELFADPQVKNRGISGDVSAGVLNRLDEITGRHPAKVFLLIGINDLGRGIAVDSILKNILRIADYIHEQCPATKTIIQSILPINNKFGKFSGQMSAREKIPVLNEALRLQAAVHHYQYLDLHSHLADAEGKLDTRYTNDGLHLNGDAYLLWKHLVWPVVYDLQEQPSLLPLPRQLEWRKGRFPLYRCKNIRLLDPSLLKEAVYLQSALEKIGIHVSIETGPAATAPVILLGTTNEIPSQGTSEYYSLSVDEQQVSLQAVTPHGLFNGIQTLLQLFRDGSMADACVIRDWPAFSWRGYMIDAGRNYCSMDLLKQQIDRMALYKLNVFHFHATEDIAWRLASSRYPQLTAPETMLRNKGLYYTKEDIRELILYCRQRHIKFVPEIDMPGHSAAFKRAMGMDMQSDSGLLIVKHILKEFCDSFDVEYVHIGADEVKITNPDFIPEVSRLLQSMGKKVIGWQPGGNFIKNTIRQLWMDDGGKINSDAQLQFIDSRHLYLNHMDPLEAVTTIFNRALCGRPEGDSLALGGTICLWNDRAAAREEDLLRMNPVYPGMLAFAERSWRGGGKKEWISNMSDGDETAFAGFEKRVLEQQFLQFRELPFPYAAQSGMKWELFGPYDNKGILSTAFAPENNKLSKLTPALTVTGGTVVLRHWWAPLIKGAVPEPVPNSTWYAVSHIWMDTARLVDCWIGFMNLSRSTATDSPPPGEWDFKSSRVWLNGMLVAPPAWRRAGQPGNSEIPLQDEGYEYRQPAQLQFIKGWNTILVKCAAGSFKGKDWQNPVKWMFTFLPLSRRY